MISALRPLKDVSELELKALEERLIRFYQNPPVSYYQIADQAADHYRPEEQPFHCHLASSVGPGDRVLEMGCGTAHLCPHIEARGAVYHGIDYSPELIAENRRKFPRAQFWVMGTQPDGEYDLVASLYTIEHVVNPPTYLQQLWDRCKPGGLIGVICPDFIDGSGIPLSVYYGTTPGRLRAKFQSGKILDGILHALEMAWLAPAWKRRARRAAPGAFWINLEPRDLAGQEHLIDGDAVHFPRMKDIRHWFESKGARVLATSESLGAIPETILMHNCYVLAQKPDGQGRPA